MSGRRDWAVILARGESRRMGRPKGLCAARPGGPTMLEAVAALYAGAGLPLAVVTTPPLAVRYRPLLAGRGETLWIERAPGGDTAASVVAALEELGERATHLWLHPVDLPGVAPATLELLARRSRRQPRAVLVPAFRGTPGHPVVLPVAGWLDLRGASPAGAMRELLREPGRGRRAVVAVDDPGVIADLDAPADRKPLPDAGAPDSTNEEGSEAT